MVWAVYLELEVKLLGKLLERWLRARWVEL